MIKYEVFCAADDDVLSTHYALIDAIKAKEIYEKHFHKEEAKAFRNALKLPDDKNAKFFILSRRYGQLANNLYIRKINEPAKIQDFVIEVENENE